MTNPVSARQATASSRTVEPAPPDPTLMRILGPPPVLASEDAEAYEALQARVRATITPADIIEEMWVRDVVDLIWEALRLRRLKAKLLAAEWHEALDAALRGRVDRTKREELVPRWAKGEPGAAEGVERALAAAGLDAATVDAVALSQRLETTERIERMIMQAEVRRHAVLREMERHREALARQLGDLAADYATAEPPAPALAFREAPEHPALAGCTWRRED